MCVSGKTGSTGLVTGTGDRCVDSLVKLTTLKTVLAFIMQHIKDMRLHH